MQSIRAIFTIDLSQNQQAIVDECDWYALRKLNWSASWAKKTKSFYARRKTVIGGRRLEERMHRRILGLSPGDNRQVDHVDHNTLDNRRSNLRIVTNRENGDNRRDQSPYGPGVSKDRRRRPHPFRASLRLGGRRVSVGSYATAQEAQQAREKFLCRSVKAAARKSSGP